MIEVNNVTRVSVDKALLIRAARKVLRGEKREKSDLSIALIGPEHMRLLNKKYRRQGNVANVLSFAESEFGLGEVILCPQRIKKDAKKYGILFRRALVWMLIHGVLHLLGYDHEKEAQTMEVKERRYLKTLNSYIHTRL